MRAEQRPSRKGRFFIGPICAIVLLLIGMTAGLVTKIPWATRAHRAIQSQHTGPTIEQVQALAELVTAKVQISDVQETTLQGYLGGVQAVLLIKGEVLLGPDLSRAHIVNVDQEGRTVVIELPTPRVINSRLDHENTRILALSHNGLWQVVPGDAGQIAVVNRALAEAQAAIAAAANERRFGDVARQHAEAAIRSVFSTAQWSAVVQWRENEN